MFAKYFNVSLTYTPLILNLKVIRMSNLFIYCALEIKHKTSYNQISVLTVVLNV
jgi:hypothetical protein